MKQVDWKGVGEGIRLARTARKESQQNFGEHFNVSQQTIGKWEGGGAINKKYWDQLYKIVGIDLSDYIVGVGQQASQVAHHNKTAHQAGRDLTVQNNKQPGLSTEEQYLIYRIRELPNPDEYLRKITAEVLGKLSRNR